jgi:hypothetical protein
VQTHVATSTLSTGSTEQFVQKEQSTKNIASEKESVKALKLSIN